MNDQTVFSLAILALNERHDRLEDLDPVGFSDAIKSCDRAIERLMVMKEINQVLSQCVCGGEIKVEWRDDEETSDKPA